MEDCVTLFCAFKDSSTVLQQYLIIEYRINVYYIKQTHLSNPSISKHLSLVENVTKFPNQNICYSKRSLFNLGSKKGYTILHQNPPPYETENCVTPFT